MKVLSILYNSQLNGVSTFNYTLLFSLKELGYECYYHIIQQDYTNSIINQKYAEAGFVNIQRNPIGHFDITILNNQMGYEYVVKFIHSKRFLYFVHSLMNPISLPPRLALIPIEIFTFSEMGKEYLSKLHYGYSATLIRNFIDMNRFVSKSKNTSKTILIFDIRNGHLYFDKVERAAKALKMKVRIISGLWSVEEKIDKANVIFAYGRSAIEAMSMGKQVIVYGVNGGDGLVTVENMSQSAKTNFSGWSLRTMPPPAQLSEFDILNELSGMESNDIDGITQHIRTEYSISENMKYIFPD